MSLALGPGNTERLRGLDSKASPSCCFSDELRIPPTACEQDDLALAGGHGATAKVLLTLRPPVPGLLDRVPQNARARHRLCYLALYGPVLEPF